MVWRYLLTYYGPAVWEKFYFTLLELEWFGVLEQCAENPFGWSVLPGLCEVVALTFVVVVTAESD